MIPPNIVDEILQTARVEEVIGEFVTLKKAGSNFKALSPFTDEKTPSFVVSPAKQIFKCFSSGKGGNVASFLMEHEHFSYPEALRWLADKYNIEIPDERPLTEEEIAAKDARESLYIVHAFAQKTFSKWLWEHEEGRSIGLSYFRERGFTDDIIKRFELGYCLESGDAFYREANKAGYKTEYLNASGLVKEYNGRQRDFFRGRVMFPIHNLTGRVIAFGGRTLRNDKKTAKYFNSPEHEIYHKSNVLYGLYQARNTIVKEERCLLVEGYTDVLAMAQAGVENVVASSGTALTKEQVRLIHRYTNDVSILYDGDPAGLKASLRGIDLILEEGLNVKIVIFPEGHDPDSFSREVSTEELRAYLDENGKDFISFKAGLLLEDAGDDPLARANAIRDIVQSIAHIPDSIARSVFIKTVSERFGINEQSLISNLNKVRRDLFKRSRPRDAQDIDLIPDEPPAKKLQPEQVDELEPQEKEIIRIILNYGDQLIELPPDEEHEEAHTESVADFILHELEVDGLTLKNPGYTRILEEVKKLRENNAPIAANHFFGHENDTVRTIAVDMASFEHTLSERWEKSHYIITRTELQRLNESVIHTVYSFKLKKIMEMIYELQGKIQQSDNEAELEEMMKQQLTLQELKKHLSSELGRDLIK